MPAARAAAVCDTAKGGKRFYPGDDSSRTYNGTFRNSRGIDHFLDDMVSEHLYDSIGFRKEGIMKNAGRQGNDYFDLQMRAILKEEWEEQKEILKAKEPEKVPQVIADYL